MEVLKLGPWSYRRILTGDHWQRIHLQSLTTLSFFVLRDMETPKGTPVETPMAKCFLNRAITPHVRDPEDREAIYHFLTLVHGHGTPVESWLTRTKIQGFDDLVAISLDYGLLKDELALTFSHEGSPVVLTTPQKARILAYFKALDVEGVDSALPSLGLTPAQLKSAMKSAPTSTPPPTTATPSSDKEKDFASSIKKNLSDFTILDKDHKYILWHSSFVGKLILHQVFDIVNPDMQPNPAEKDFAVKQEYAFQIFERVLQSPRTAPLLVTHHLKRDPRPLYADLLAEFSVENPHTETMETELEDWLKTTKLDSWDRSYASYFATFEKKLLLLETTQGEPVTAREKKKWLRESIKSHPKFYSSYAQMKVKCALDHRELEYDEVLRVSKLICIEFDKDRVTKRGARKAAKAKAKAERKANEAKQKRSSQWWIEPDVWKAMTKAAQDEHKAKF